MSRSRYGPAQPRHRGPGARAGPSRDEDGLDHGERRWSSPRRWTALDPIDIEELARRLRDRREERGLSLRAAATEADVPFNTFSRVERGYMPDLGSYARLTSWLGLDAGAFFPEPARRRQDDTTTTIREHLHADPFLTDEAAERIAGLVTDLYRNLAAPPTQTEIHLRAHTTFTPDAAVRLAGILEHVQERLLADPSLGSEPGWNPI